MSYPETIAEELSNIAKEFIESFHCKTFVSTLTRETNNLEDLVVTANTLLQQTLGYKDTDNIVLLTPEKLTHHNVRHDKTNRLPSADNRVPSGENYVSGVEVLYMNLHSPQLDKILHTYLKDDDVTAGCDVTNDDVIAGGNDVTISRLVEKVGALGQSGVETAV